MKIIYEYSHLGGGEILQVRFHQIREEIYSVIQKSGAVRNKISREKNKQGRWLFSPVEMNRQFRQRFHELGYRELRDQYTIELPDSPIKIPNVYKSIDFWKEQVLVEVQFGNILSCFMIWQSFNTSTMKTKLRLVWRLSHVITSTVRCHREYPMGSS